MFPCLVVRNFNVFGFIHHVAIYVTFTADEYPNATSCMDLFNNGIVRSGSFLVNGSLTYCAFIGKLLFIQHLALKLTKMLINLSM